MWKYVTKELSNQFLLSLNLLESRTDQQIIKVIYSISNNIESNYNTFIISKNNKERIINAPKRTLRQIQKNILNNILEDRKLSTYAKAYRKGYNLKDNASIHCEKDKILKLDIKDFFNNITFDKVYKKCFPFEYFPYGLGILLTNLCMKDGRLPQGAPTSAYISNLIMRDFDEEIGLYCLNNNINYTRYADDMTFSGAMETKKIIIKVKQALRKLNLFLNTDKTRVIAKNRCQLVTGIVVNKKLNVKRDYRGQIRKEMYYINKFGLDDHLKTLNIIDRLIYIQRLKGRIQFVLQITPDNVEFKKYEEKVNALI